MVGVSLDEAEAEARGIDVLHLGRARASCRNLATLASKLYDPAGRRLWAVDIGAAAAAYQRALRGSLDGDLDGEPGSPSDAERPTLDFMEPVGEATLDCLVCGSRGGQVTLPALWLLGCRLPCVVVNGGCCREEVGWAWPAGAVVVLLTGGDDFFNGHRKSWDPADDPADRLQCRDRLYLAELWRAVPAASRRSAAICHVPTMGHRPPAALLSALLPPLVRYAAARLASDAKPSGGGGGLGGEPCLLVTAGCPEGEWL